MDFTVDVSAPIEDGIIESNGNTILYFLLTSFIELN